MGLGGCAGQECQGEEGGRGRGGEGGGENICLAHLGQYKSSLKDSFTARISVIV